MRLINCGFHPRTRDSIADHEHSHVEWHYVLGGRCGFLLAGRDIRIAPGDCFAVLPGDPHGIRMHCRDDWLLQYILHSEDDDLANAWQRKAGRRGSLAIGEGRHAFFARLAHDMDSDDAWRRQAAIHRFAAMLCERLAGPARPEVHPAVERGLELMRHHLRDELDLDRLAAHVQLDRSYLSRLFSRELGCAPMRYYLGMKMELAAAMLRGGERPVGEIAEAVGFADPFHFSRRFSRWAGCAPSDYRRRHGCGAEARSASPMR